eukprot:5293730-Prymnesium_polylepis.1
MKDGKWDLAHLSLDSVWTGLCGCPIWDLPPVSARYDAEFRGRLLAPGGFLLAGHVNHASL